MTATRRSTELSRGYLLSAIAAAGFTVTVTLDVVDALDLVSRLAAAGLLCVVSAAIAITATGLIRPPRPVPFLFTIVFIATAGIAVFGAIFTIQDYLSESGFNDIGAAALYSFGLVLSPISALLMIGLALVCKTKERKNLLEK